MRFSFKFLILLVLSLAALAWFVFALFNWMNVINVDNFDLKFSNVGEKINTILPTEEEEDRISFGSSTNTLVLKDNLNIPWQTVFLSDNEILITERSGKIILTDFNQDIEVKLPISTRILSTGEGGLLGIDIHPKFELNNFVYLMYTYRDASSGDISNRVSRFVLQKNSETDIELIDESILVDKIPGGNIHNGGRIKFGPDDNLWVLVGDAGRAALAQDPKSLAGKVLRIDQDGFVPTDNPIDGSIVYSLGHRNPQGITWLEDQVFVVEHGNVAYDEINKLEPGGNYGWPVVTECFGNDSRFIDPLLCSGQETWAPSDIVFVEELERLFVSTLRGNSLLEVKYTEDKLELVDKHLDGLFGRLRSLVLREGKLFITTSNRDGRGRPSQYDDILFEFTWGLN